MSDEVAFALLMDSLKAIRAAVEKAKSRGCTYYSDKEDWQRFTYQMIFQSAQGKTYKKTLHFKHGYKERCATPIEFGAQLYFYMGIRSYASQCEGIEPLPSSEMKTPSQRS
jgi:hypothetical protein